MGGDDRRQNRFWPILPSSIHFKSTVLLAVTLWQFCNRENKAFDLAYASRRHRLKKPEKPWHKNCTVWFDHYWHCPYCVSLLPLQYSQVHRDSQNTGEGRNRESVHPRKMPFYWNKAPLLALGTFMKNEGLCTVEPESYCSWVHFV